MPTSAKRSIGPGLQQDNGGEHPADARHAVQQGVLGSFAHAFLQTLFKQFDLRGQRRDDRHVALIARQTSAGSASWSIVSAVSRLTWLLLIRAAHLRAMMFSTARMCAGATAHQLHALAGQIAHRALLRRQDGARRQYPQPQQVRQDDAHRFRRRCA